MLISSKKVLCLAMSALTAFSVCLTGCGKDTQPSVSATENPHYATVEVEHAPAALDNTGWDGMVFRAGETYDF